MRRPPLSRFVLMAALALAPGAPRAADHFPVRRVFDGDTIDLGQVGRVRLLGIDAPEMGLGLDTPAPFAAEARDRLRSLLVGRYVHLEGDGPVSDKYGRRLAYVFRDDGLFVNAEMLRSGLAHVSARRQMRRLGELRAAERIARVARLGIWGRSAVPPLEGPIRLRPHDRIRRQDVRFTCRLPSVPCAFRLHPSVLRSSR